MLSRRPNRQKETNQPSCLTNRGDLKINGSDLFGFCQRPLNNYSGEKGAGPPLLNHQFIRVTQQDGTILCDSQNNPDNHSNGVLRPSLGLPSLPESDNMDNSSCDQINDDKDQCFEQCVLNEWKRPRPQYAIGPLGTDCQEYSSKIAFKCSLTCSIEAGRK